jgi:N6-adenosine-specific RNA methylase IME4
MDHNEEGRHLGKDGTLQIIVEQLGGELEKTDTPKSAYKQEPRPRHTLAKLFPPMRAGEFDALRESIRENGQREAITLLDGAVIDGIHREAACLELAVEPQYAALSAGVDPLQYVVDRNQNRRHLNDDQRRLIAAEIASMKRGRPAENNNSANGEISRAAAAKMMRVDIAGVDRAKVITTKGIPELKNVVKEGVATVRAAAEIATLSPEHQQAVVLSLPKDGAGKFTPEAKRLIRQAARSVRHDDQAAKKQRRADREQKLGREIASLPEGKFGLILTDDEWDHQVHSRETGMDRHAMNHYETAVNAHTAAEMHERTKSRFECASDNFLLAMWSTVQHLDVAIDLLRLRGCRYVSHYVWGKDKIGLGYWNRNKHEILLLGVRGDIPCPAPGDQRNSLIMAPRGNHSAKPECFLEMLEAYFPTTPKIELNRRGPPRPGWKAWGNGVEAEAPGPEMQIDVAIEKISLAGLGIKTVGSWAFTCLKNDLPQETKDIIKRYIIPNVGHRSLKQIDKIDSIHCRPKTKKKITPKTDLQISQAWAILKKLYLDAANGTASRETVRGNT